MCNNATRRRMTIWFRPVCLILVILRAEPLLAADVNSPEDVRALIQQAKALNADLDSVHEWQQDGLNRRIDQLGLKAITGLNRLAAESMTAAAMKESQREELIALLDEAVTLALERDRLLDQRVATERKLVPKFEQSPEADIARAFMEGLVLLRESYLNGLAKQVEIRRALGLENAVLIEKVRKRVSSIIEVLSGQIHLDATSLDELQSRLTDQPLDEDLKKAFTLVQVKQASNLDRLERILDSSRRLGIDATEQRSLLLRERGEVAVDLLQRDVFLHLWQEELQQLREGFTRNGPNLLLRTLLFVFILLIAIGIARVIRIPLRALLSRESVTLSVLLRDVVISLASAVVLLTGLITALVAMGVSIGHLFAGLGVIGIIVGLAVQDSLRNLAAGVMILAYRPYDVDDHIKLGSEDGHVKKMNLLATTISTLDNQSVVIPNGKIWGETIINLTANRIRRVDIKTSVAYAEDLNRVEAVILDLLDSVDYVLKKPEPAVHVTGMEDSAVGVVAKPWVRTENYLRAYWDLNKKIKQRLDAEGIEIPFPQRVVTLIADEPDPK